MPPECAWPSPLLPMSDSRFLLHSIFKRHHLFRKEEEMVAWHNTFIPLHLPRIVIQCDNEIETILEILVDGLNSGNLPLEHNVKSIGQRSLRPCPPATRVQTDTISGLYSLASDEYRLWRRVILTGEVSVSAVHAALPYSSLLYATLT